MTRAFLVHESLRPRGTLFEHCNPQSMAGLFTARSNLEPRGNEFCCTSAFAAARTLQNMHRKCATVRSTWQLDDATTLQNKMLRLQMKAVGTEEGCMATASS